MKTSIYSQPRGPFGDTLYDRAYGTSLAVLKNVVPFMSTEDGQTAQLVALVKAIPRLIAAGSHKSMPGMNRARWFARGALYAREAVVILSYCRDLHNRYVNAALCHEIIEVYLSVADRLGEMVLEILPEGLSDTNLSGADDDTMMDIPEVAS